MLLETENIFKTYQQGKDPIPILKGISLAIPKGEFISIMGASGSGKSTLLNCLSSLDLADQGSIFFNGQNYANLTEDQLADMRKDQMGFVFQEATLLKNLNILDNILLPHQLRTNHSPQSLESKARDLMEQLGIGGLENRGIQEVSGGQLQRAGICRAILHEPQILFADEPTGALNSQSGMEVMDIFQTLHQEGMAILMVTHDPKIAAYSDKILLMRDGKIIETLAYKSQEIQDHASKVKALSQSLLNLGI